MKSTAKILGLMLFLTLFTFTSCHKKSDDDEVQNDSTNSRITLKIDNGNETIYTDVNAMVMNNQLVIGGSDTNSDIQMIVDPDISQGTYGSNQVLMSHGMNSQAIFTTVTNVTSLTFEVISHDMTAKHIKGTFSLEFTDNQNVSLTHTATGTFNVYYR